MSDHPAVVAFLNWASAASVIGTLLGILPHIAAALGVIWYLILIWDHFAKKRKAKK